MQSQQPTIYKQGDLWWCDPDPQRTDSVGSEQRGDRPWLIISTESLHRGDCLVGLPLSRHTDKAIAHLTQVPADCITMVDGTASMDRVALTEGSGLSLRSD
jgi:mRNA-degrading endonuclease toxin of MazEF toxin-antitoxin module